MRRLGFGRKMPLFKHSYRFPSDSTRSILDLILDQLGDRPMRTVIDHNLSTHAARLRLPTRKKPFFKSIQPNVHIGYVRQERKGTWVGRVWINGRYTTAFLGESDDFSNRGASYSQAVGNVRTWAEGKLEEARLVELGEDPIPAEGYLVKHAIADYLEFVTGEGRKSVKKTIEPALRVHVLSTPLAEMAVQDLTTKRLRRWLWSLAASAPRRRTSKLTPAKQNVGPAPETPELARRRKVTANNCRSLFFAALNHAFLEGRVKSDSAWRRVKPFGKVDEAKVRWLEVEETKRLLAALNEDLRKLAAAALLTGARVGELSSMTVGSFDPSSATIYIPPYTKSSKARHVFLTPEGGRFFSLATKGKKHSELIFRRSDGAAWGKSHTNEPLKKACAAARIEPAISIHILRHTHASLMAMAGCPMAMIAKQLGHASVKTTEKYYGHLSPASVGQQVRATLPAFGIGKQK